MRLLLPRLLAVLAITTLLPGVSPAATYTVTVTNDSGAGSLRQAILDANTNGGTDLIDFNIATGTTIPAATNLPPITDPVTIDATTQPGWVNAPIIELNGTNIGGAGQDGFKIWAGGTTIRGLVINRFTGDGIEIATNGNNIIEGCYIGTGLSGTNDLGNTLCGVFVTNSVNNAIGSTNAGRGNVISGNNQQGILIGGSNSLGNQILGNLIGLGANGSNTVANSQNGVHVHNSRSNVIGGTVTGARNVISGNSQAGIRVELAQAFGNQILGNYIGLEVSGGTNRANAVNGVTLINAPSNYVGNATSEGRNIIAGNTGIGISVSTANYTTIQGNYIGTDATGTLDRGNTTDGINVTTSLYATIGGTNASEMNLISGNTGDGLELSGVTTAFASVRGNLIGTDLTGTNALGNNGHGIQFTTTARTNTIGGIATGQANTIAFNGTDGVFVGSGSNNVVRGNSIFSNTDQGIDIGANGVQANDSFDTDTGANQLMNFPVLVSASNSPTDTVIEFRMNSWTNITVDIDFYANALADASGNGEGQFYLGSTNALLPDADSNLVFTVSLPTGPLTVRHITATATDQFGNTSEFSPAETVVSSVAGQTFTVINTNGSGAGSLRQAILDANNAVTAGDTIAFDIPGTGPFFINPGSALPALTDADTTIDGFTQTNSAANTITTSNNAVVLIRVDGSGLGTVDGLKVANSNCVIRGLSITRFGSDGIELATNASNCRVEGCFIGVTPDGTNAANTANGIFVNNVANTTIGGTNVAARNVISANSSDGIELSGTGATGTIVQGNLIGLAPNGTTDRGNGADGVFITGANGNTIGGAADGARNVISGNASDGIQITGAGASNNVVLGNFLGTDYTGTTGVPNDSYGINISLGVTGSTIGSPGAGNVIAFNGLDGVGILTASPSPTNNAIRANYIFNNDDLGIDLQTNGVAFNDLTDADTGANNQQNHPVLTAVTNTGTDTTFYGTLNGPDLSTFTFDFFANTIPDASGNGEGQFYLGSTNFTTGGGVSNTHSFALTLPVANLPGLYITATATDSSGNSSEFSPALAAVSTLAGTTYTVINTNDSGAGSLREAIQFANTNINAGDTIAFNIPGAGEQMIRPQSPLPIIIDPVTIDGYTQPGSVTNSSTTGFNGTLLIRLEAASAGLGQPGLFIAGGGSTVRGLMITRTPGHGIAIATNGINTIAGCIIGLDSASVDVGGTNNGVLINISPGNTIGGTNIADRNVISGNTGDGIEIIGGAATGNVILGNLIGTDLLGTTNRANSDNGILVTTAVGTIIGASSGEIRNVISGNTDTGISLVNAAGTVILGNYIGTDATGTLDRGNGVDGIIANGATNSIIGGSNAGEGNLISGNDDGIEVAGATNVVILGNRIGTDVTGTLAIGNANSGINLSGAARFNLIGGTGAGEANIIANNGTDGVLVSSGTNNAIRANSIYSNGDLGIDLGATAGVSTNDVGDGDSGGNQVQNFPVLTTATNDIVGTTISGTLNSATNATFALDFFSNVALETSGHGEGQAYLGSTNITTDGTGNAAFAVQLAVTNLTGRYITATATATNRSTSEFSRSIVAVSTLTGTAFSVINTNDSGAGSLRQAILDANAAITSGDTISFNIPGAGVQTIRPLTALPTIIDPVTIDGYTQPGSVTNSSLTAFNGTVLIRLDGSNAPSNTDNLKFTVGNNTVRGLVIINALGTSGDGLDFSGGNNNVIEGCLIGIDVDGLDRGNGGNGVLFTVSSSNLVGGGSVAARNVISGNTGDGIEISGPGAFANRILGNLIGTGLGGTNDVGNNVNGIYLLSASGTFVGGTNALERNVISGNTSDGVEILGVAATNNFILGNFIGLDAAGTTVLGNSASGVVLNSAPNNTIGGTAAGAGNVISGNNQGVSISNGGSSNNVVEGNSIGTDATGTLDRGNSANGILINDTLFNRIGGATAAARNLISGNGSDGIEITSVGAGGRNQIFGNWIGLGSAGAALGNTGNGILLSGAMHGNLVGGAGAGEANIIANNSVDGVQIGTSSTNNAIRLNSIYGNGDLGIDLGTSGVTTNDLNDPDAGANHQQNFPVITAATNSLSTIVVEGSLNSWPLANFNVDIFANVSIEPSGAGEGQVYLGSTNVTTDGAGNGSFSVSLPGTLTGRYITATATDTNGNTSEFSTQFFAASDIPATNFVVINTNDSGPGSLRDAITNANGYISGGNDTISFAIPGTGPHIISPASALPALIDPVTIDGFTQTNAAANTLTNGLNTVLQIQLNGSGAGAGVDGLQVAVSGCIIRGLAITGFTQDGVDISHGTGSSVEGCFIGMDTDGVTHRGNNGSGINISASTTSANFIGAETPAARNLISANTSYGVAISSSRQNVIAGNLIGTDLTGLLDRGNTNSGVLISGSTAVLNLIGGTNAAARNILSGNGNGFNGAGVLLSGCISNFIYGNYCGVNVTGTSALANGENGIEVINAAHTNFIGGPLTGAGNVLSGNPNAGVYFFGGDTSIGNIIQGNRIGADASGMTAIPNLNRGVLVGTARGTLVGGANPGEGNLISGNTYYGVDISCCGTTTNRILGNWIGTDATGTNALPNEIGIDVGSSDNAIGGTNAGEGNRIWFNETDGIYLYSGASRVAILGNSFYANGDLAIDLEGNGVTLNDAGDTDTGGNNRQNFPVLTFALTDTNANTLAVPGTFNGASNSTFRLEFFASPAKDATGYGEGRDYLGTTNITTDASGNASYVFETSPTPATGWFIAATATTTNGSTSEFSAATKVVPFDSVDLQIALTASTNPASITLGFNYTNTVVNAGPTNATSVLVTNFLPAGVSVVSSNATQGTVSTTPGFVIWNVGNLDYASNAVLVLAVNGGTTGLATNTGTVMSAGTDHTLENNTTNRVIALGIADLALTLEDSPDPVMAGQALTLITTITNLGPDPATQITGYLTLPSSLVVTSAVASQGSSVNVAFSYNWNVGTLAAGGFATFTFIGIPTAQAVIDTSASASPLETDPISANNSAAITTTVDPGAGILQFTSTGYSVAESGGSATVVVQRTGGSIGTVTVDLFTSDLTANTGSDYTGTNVTLTLTNGEVFQFVSVPVLDDLSAECNELFSVALTNATGGALTLLITNTSVLIFDDELTASGGITLASRSTNGASGDDGSYYEAFPSADGRFVAFTSYAGDLVPGDANGDQDIFIINVTNGTISLVSAALSGASSGNDYSEQPRVSTDGRFVAFYSESTNLVAGATNRFGDIFLRDSVAGTTRLISVSTNGTGGGNDTAWNLRMTPDARFIVFESWSTNLVLNDLNGFNRDVFLRDTNSGNVELISVNSTDTGSANNDSYNAAVSADGRYVAFESEASNLGPADANFANDVYVRDRNLGSNFLCSLALGGGSANDYSYDPLISSNGVIVLFYSYATNLVIGDTNDTQKIYAYNTTNHTVQLVTVNTNGTSGDSSSYSARISADGRYVAFESYASDLVANDLNGDYGDIFLRDLVGGTTTLISVNCSGTGSGNSDSYTPAISDDGRYVAFNSVATDLAPGNFSAGYEQIFRHDRLTGQTVLVSQNAGITGPGDSYSYYAEINADGRIVAFITDATDLTTNSYVYDPNVVFWDVDAAPPLVGSVNLFLAKTASTNTLVEFTPLTYSLAITNLGTLAATGVVVTDALPASVSFIAASTSVGTVTNIAGLVTANLGALGIGSSALVTITTMPTNFGLVTNLAFTLASETDLVQADNTNSVIVTVTTWPPPTLYTLRTNSQVLILWPSNTPPVFVLETKTNLQPAVIWSSVTNSVAILGTNNAVTLTPDLSERTRFFRLRR